jgi:hypothetical protein
MDVFSLRANWRLCLTAAVLAASPLAAQQSVDLSTPSGPPPDQGNLFETHEPHGPEGLKPGPSFFTSGKPLPMFDILPGSQPPPPISPEQAMRMQKFEDDQKNWTLLTPEEILGVPNEAKILGVPDPDADKNLTATERYLNRLDAEDRAVSATNALREQNAALLDGSGQNADGSGADSLFGTKSDKVETDIWGRPVSQPDPNDEDQKRDAIWKSAFDHPPVAPKPDPQQVADMDRFRVLLGSIAPEKPVEASQPLQPIAPVVDPNMEQLPAFNPNGNSFTPVKENVYQPKGLMPLSGIATRPPELPAKPSPSAPKLPPWMSNQMPPPGSEQRVF